MSASFSQANHTSLSARKSALGVRFPRGMEGTVARLALIKNARHSDTEKTVSSYGGLADRA